MPRRREKISKSQAAMFFLGFLVLMGYYEQVMVSAEGISPTSDAN